MDRWGPSEDCPNCGRTRSYGDFVQCARCDKTICKDCRSHHLCERSNISYKDIVDKLKAKIPEIGMGYYPVIVKEVTMDVNITVFSFPVKVRDLRL
jgi:hypothetical protein